MSSETENDHKETTTTSPDDSKKELSSQANIEKAVRFWKHPSLKDIPIDQKQHYLRERGVSEEEIHKAWEKISLEPPSSDALAKNDNAHPLLHPFKLNEPPYPQNSTQYPNQYTPGSHNNAYPSYPQQQQQLDDEGPLSMIQGASLVTLGGFIGLAAAASSRWLNGGDFQLLPKPSVGDPRTVSEQRSLFLQRLEQEQSEEEDEDDEELVFLEDNSVDHEVAAALVQEKLLQQVESIAENLKANVEVQEKVLKKLTNCNGSSITDQTMNFLKEDKSETNNIDNEGILKLWAELVEIKAELRLLCSKGKNKEMEKKAQTTLSSLETCIEQIQSSIFTSPSVQTPSTTAKELSSSKTSLLLDVGQHEQTTETSEPNQPENNNEGNASDGRDENSQSVIAHTLQDSIKALAEQNDETSRRVGCQLLYLYIVNLSGKPENPRYRKIFTCNESFQKVEILKGGKELLFAVGFSEQKGFLEWLPNGTSEQETTAMIKLKDAAAALGILKSGKPSGDDLTVSAMEMLSKDNCSGENASTTTS